MGALVISRAEAGEIIDMEPAALLARRPYLVPLSQCRLQYPHRRLIPALARNVAAPTCIPVKAGIQNPDQARGGVWVGLSL